MNVESAEEKNDVRYPHRFKAIGMVSLILSGMKRSKKGRISPNDFVDNPVMRENSVSQEPAP